MQPHFIGNMLFYRWVNMGKGANRAGNSTGRNFFPRLLQPLMTTFEFGIECCQLQTKGCRFSVNTVATPNCRGVFMFIGALIQRIEQAVDAGK